MALTAKIVCSLYALLSNALDLQSAESTLNEVYTTSLSNGTGQGQANMQFSDTRALTASASESLDLAGGLTSPLGTTITFTKIKALFIKAAATNTGNLKVGEGVANAFVGPFGASAVGNLVAPGGTLLLMAPVDGWTVTAGTGDLLKIENLVAAAAAYDIVLIGTV